MGGFNLKVVIMGDRVYILISIPKDFKDKFIAFLRNLNVINSHDKSPIIVQNVYTDNPKTILKEGLNERENGTGTNNQ
jgi:hypothetical protein